MKTRDLGPLHRHGGSRLHCFFDGGLAALEACVEAVDRLNVFPVPDADTGGNLLRTLRAAVRAVQEVSADHLGEVARALAAGALRGAQGNSGVILAQALVGLAESFGERSDVGTRGWARGWQSAARSAYDGVTEPVEGTMLTVVRLAAEAASAAAASGAEFPTLWRQMIQAAERAVADSPRLLPRLHQAGVVDAGGLGLALVLRGGVAAFTGEALPRPEDLPVPSAATLQVIRTAEFPRYCTELLLSGENLRRETLEDRLRKFGDSVDVIWLVDGQADRTRARIHVHTDRPGEVADWAARLGEVSGFKADDLERQREAFLVASGDLESQTAARQPRRRRGPPARRRIRVVTDSSADLTAEQATELGVAIVPAVVSFGDESFLDGVEITADTFYRRLVSDRLHPTTSQPSPGRFAETYDRLGEGAAGIVSIHLSDRLSGTGNAARQGARISRAPCPVEVVDSGSTSTGMGLVVLEAARRARQGACFEEVLAAARDNAARSRARFTLDTLEFLARGGRIGRARKFLGDVLRIRPVLEVRNGVVAPAARVRSRPQALALLRRFAEENRPLKALSVLYTTGRREAEELVREITPLSPNGSVLLARVGPGLGSHLGPGTLGVALLRQDIK